MIISQRLIKICLLAVVLLAVSACSTAPRFDDRHKTQGFDHRLQWIVLHYTAENLDNSISALTRGNVSSHYLLDGRVIYRLADERYRTWHAGKSEWHGRTWLNATTIGIEMVHPGYTETNGVRIWHPWPNDMVDALIPLLKDIRQRYALEIDSVIAHSDIAPQRKLDPGPLFPWFRVAREGLIRWPLYADIQRQMALYQNDLPDMTWFQQQLSLIGYSIEATGQLDQQTRNVLAAVQMKYRSRLFDGEPDAETAAILWSLAAQQTL